MTELLTTITSWIASHPNLAGLVIFLTAFTESLAFVGLVIPGATLMVSAGALVATGSLAFWATMWWAIAGAVLADGFSFWLGRTYKQRLRAFVLFRRYPQMLLVGEAFFRRHGGKSVFLGRFIGPIRPVIPLVAGMLGMGRTRFTVYNVLSALGWAPSYLLLGMAFGASLAMAGEVAGRLAVLVVLLFLAAWLVFNLFHHAFIFVAHRLPGWLLGFRHLVTRIPLLNFWLGGLLDPQGRLFRPITVLLFFTGAASWLFLGITEDVVSGDPLVQSSKGIYFLLQGLRSTWGDMLMIAITMLGDSQVTVPLVLLVLGWLLAKKEYFSALNLTGATLGGFLLVTIIKEVTRIPRPVEMYRGAVHWAFPSSHATMSLIIYGFLALLWSRGLAPRRRWLPFALALFLVLTIGFSRLYLGAHWFSDVVGGFSLGLAWLAIMAIIQLHGHPPRKVQGVAPVILLGLAVLASWHWAVDYGQNEQRYAQRHSQQAMASITWQKTGWQQFPDRRLDLEGEKEQLLNIQYVGSLHLLRQRLRQAGWQIPQPLTPATALHWLMSRPQWADVPILPQLHDGRAEQLLLIRPIAGDPSTFLALRLWPGDTIIDKSSPLWVGSISQMEFRHYLNFFHLPRTLNSVSAEILLPALPAAAVRQKTIQQHLLLLISLPVFKEPEVKRGSI